MCENNLNVMDSFCDFINSQGFQQQVARVLESKAIDLNKNIEKFDEDLVKIYCPKGYKTVCEPAYCSFQHTNTCDYLKILGIIRKRYKINVNERSLVIST